MADAVTQSGNAQEEPEALLKRFRDTLPAEVQAGVLHHVTNNPNMSPDEVAALMRDTLAQYGEANGLVAAPNGMELRTEVGEVRQQYANGFTTTTSDDIERLTFAVQNTVKQMIAQGATDAEIQQAVGQLPGVTPELAAVAEQVAQQQLDAEKFALLDTRNQQPQVAPPALNMAVLFDTPMMSLAAPTVADQPREATPANPLASLIAGMEISHELRNLNAQAQASVNRADTGQFSTQLAALTQQRSNDGTGHSP